jgi:RNA recognition motif-containing protein
MLPHPIDELVLYQLFIAYGELREVYVIRLPDVSSRGCAFIKYRQRSEALAAIEGLNEIIPPVNTPFHRFMQLSSIALM